MAKQGNALVLYSLGGHRSSCASTTAIENDDNCYSIDDLEESKACRFVTPILGIPRTVAYGLARPFVEGRLMFGFWYKHHHLYHGDGEQCIMWDEMYTLLKGGELGAQIIYLWEL
jgi:hypothetical protein